MATNALPKPYRVPKDRKKPLRFWEVTLELPRTDGTTRRRLPIRSKDKATVIRESLKAWTRLQTTGDLPTENQTVEQWFTYWLGRAKKSKKPKTYAGYASVINAHIIPTIGKVRLNRLTAAHIYRVHDRILNTPKNPNDPTKGFLSPTYALNAHRVMSSSLTDAEREGRIARNVAKLAEAPRKANTQLQVLTLEEAARLVQLFRTGETEKYLWAVLILTGGRRGEVLGLTWDRITDVVDFSWQLQRLKLTDTPGIPDVPADNEYTHLTGGLYLTRPKSTSSVRIFPMKGDLLAILTEWRHNAPPNKYNLVFTTPTGEPIDPDRATEQWPHILKAAGIHKHLRLHDLRHTAVDVAYASGMPEAVMKELFGHSAVSMTRAYRSKGNRLMLDRAAEAFSEQFALPGS